jgi:hypothetical protein
MLVPFHHRERGHCHDADPVVVPMSTGGSRVALPQEGDGHTAALRFHAMEGQGDRMRRLSPLLEHYPALTSPAPFLGRGSALILRTALSL